MLIRTNPTYVSSSKKQLRRLIHLSDILHPILPSDLNPADIAVGAVEEVGASGKTQMSALEPLSDQVGLSVLPSKISGQVESLASASQKQQNSMTLRASIGEPAKPQAYLRMANIHRVLKLEVMI